MQDIIKSNKVVPTIIFIIGMGRSGTSALTRLINIMGINIGQNLMPAHITNEKGFWEDLDIVILNDKILNIYNSTWFTVAPLPANWQNYSQIELLETEANNILTTVYANHAYSVIKDPRMCRLMPFWLPLLKRSGFNAKFIYNLRNPLEVAESLKKRDNLSLLHALALWLDHNLNAEYDTRNYPRVFVTYDAVMSHPLHVLKYIGKKLKLLYTTSTHEVESQVNDFLDKNLRHNVIKPENIANFEYPVISQWMVELYFLFHSMKTNNFINKITGKIARLDNLRINLAKLSCYEEEKLEEHLNKLMQADKAFVVSNTSMFKKIR
jgi:hypothetical protein